MFAKTFKKFPASLSCMIAAIGLLASASASATNYGGVEFPGGASSFADTVVTYDPLFGGTSGPAASAQHFLNSLGIPDGNYVSLGQGGRIVLRFTDNSLTGSGTPALDLWIFEVGPDVEDTFVDISKDGVTWHSIGGVGGSTAGINIDAFGFGTSDFFSFVRLTDDPNEGQRGSGGTVGADIDAVGAIASAAPVPGIPEPETYAMLLAGLGLLGFAARRRKQHAG